MTGFSEPDKRHNKWMGGEDEGLKLMKHRLLEEAIVSLVNTELDCMGLVQNSELTCIIIVWFTGLN